MTKQAGDPGVRRVHLTPATRDLDTAREWFAQFEGAGLDGIVAKPLAGTYQPDKRVMFKIKHERTADCVVAGYRVHKSGPDAIGSLLLGLYDDAGALASVGVIGAFPMARRKELFTELQPLVTTFDSHPWNWGGQMAEAATRTSARGRRVAVERGQGPVLRPAATRARGRSALRPHGGAAVPAHRPVLPVAARPHAHLLHLRTAGAARHLRAGRHRARASAPPAGNALAVSRRRRGDTGRTARRPPRAGRRGSARVADPRTACRR